MIIKMNSNYDVVETSIIGRYDGSTTIKVTNTDNNKSLLFGYKDTIELSENGDTVGTVKISKDEMVMLSKFGNCANGRIEESNNRYLFKTVICVNEFLCDDSTDAHTVVSAIDFIEKHLN